MRFLQNKEIIKMLLVQATICVIAAVVAFIWDIRFGCFTLGLSIIMIIISIVVTYRRYRRIYELSAEIDRIMHTGDMDLSPEKYHEGELSVLQSEIHKMTCRLRDQRQQLQDDKVYLADMIADISHQIRTPLTSANLLVSFLTEADLTDERRIRLASKLLDLLSRIDWLISSLLKMSRLDAGTVCLKKQTVEMKQLISEFTAPLLIPIELREQKLEIDAKGEFTGDVEWTAEAMSNIVKNCMEHTPSGGSIQIQASENALYSQIVISDNGSGIRAEDLPHIFERFYKSKQSDKNSFGIGLALARTIITAQNGTIKAENRMPSGTVFTVKFYKGTI